MLAHVLSGIWYRDGFGVAVDRRREILTALVESGKLECSGAPGAFGTKYYI